MAIINTLGRRKTAVARVYLTTGGKGKIEVNNKDMKEYFPTTLLQDTVNRAFATLEVVGKYDVKANIKGGGITGQAEALSLGISRALVKEDEAANPETEDQAVKPALKKLGLMTRDPRMVERKKFGQKKARKKFQFSKR
ncbi:MAG: 30S ribosomal protein S9 [Flavobacteriales bacterium]|nr:30S ribosomal protein S9 [Flavobacteriales bacterium]